MKMASLVILVPPRRGPAGHGASPWPRRPAAPGRSTRARTASARSSTRSPRRRNNNGSAFAGLTANTPFYNITLGLAMFFGRFWIEGPDPRDRRLAGREEDRAGRRGHAADAHAALRRAARRRGAPRRRADLHPGARARARSSSTCRCSRWRDREASRCQAECKARKLFEPAIVRRAIVDSFRKLDPRHQVAQPGHVRRRGRQRPHDGPLRAGAARPRRGARRVHPRRLALALVHRALRELRRGDGRGPRQGAGRRPAQARARRWSPSGSPSRATGPGWAPVPSRMLRKGDVVLVEAGDIIPGDGEIVEGVASVDESAITGESAPVIRESGGDRSAVTGGTRVLSDWLVVRISAEPGRDVPRPDDRDGRGREAPEDAERDRALTSCSPR